MTKENLFDNRVEAGERLGSIIRAKKITKKDLCERAHISRPTLDKMLDGKIENKITFDKQLEKVLGAIGMSADEFARCPIPTMGSNIAKYRVMLGYSQDELAERIGVSVSNVKKWESDPYGISEEEWSDIALALNTDSASVKGNNMISCQMPIYDYVLRESDDHDELSGFAGFIIITPDNSSEEFSFAVTRRESRGAMGSLHSSRVVFIPCMGNKLLLVNVDNIKKIEFLDDDYDGLDAHREYLDFVPNEMFNLLDDYFMGGYEDDEIMSEKHRKLVEDFIKDSGCAQDLLENRISNIVVHFTDGKQETLPVDNFTMASELMVSLIFNDHAADDCKGVYFGINDEFEDNNLFFNLNKLSFIEMPLMKVEKEMHSKE